MIKTWEGETHKDQRIEIKAHQKSYQKSKFGSFNKLGHISVRPFTFYE